LRPAPPNGRGTQQANAATNLAGAAHWLMEGVGAPVTKLCGGGALRPFEVQWRRHWFDGPDDSGRRGGWTLPHARAALAGVCSVLGGLRAQGRLGRGIEEPPPPADWREARNAL